MNWLLARGYQVHCKVYSRSRAQRLAASVQYWVDDPSVQGRQVGWVYLPASEYIRPVRRLAVRCRKVKGQWSIGVLISTLSPAEVLTLTQVMTGSDADPVTTLLAHVSFYDQRGGGVEISFKGDQQGLGSTKRSKKHGSRAPDGDAVGNLGSQCRDLGSPVADPGCCAIQTATLWHSAHGARCLHFSGFLVLDASGHIVQIVLNQAFPLAPILVDSLRMLLVPTHMAVNSGETEVFNNTPARITAKPTSYTSFP